MAAYSLDLNADDTYDFIVEALGGSSGNYFLFALSDGGGGWRTAHLAAAAETVSVATSTHSGAYDILVAVTQLPEGQLSPYPTYRVHTYDGRGRYVPGRLVDLREGAYFACGPGLWEHDFSRTVYASALPQ